MNAARKRARIVWGGWAGHEPEQGAEIVAGMLRAAGFRVSATGTAGLAGLLVPAGAPTRNETVAVIFSGTSRP